MRESVDQEPSCRKAGRAGRGAPLFARFAPLLALAVASHGSAFAASPDEPRFEVTLPEGVRSAPVTGRLVLAIADRAEPEPRLRISPHGPRLLAVDVHDWVPGTEVLVGGNALGYPGPLAELGPGEFFVQAVLNVYEEVHRADGHTLWLPTTDGTVQFFSAAPGNLHSEPVRFVADSDPKVAITLSQVVPEPPAPQDTEWVKHFRMKSELLSRFWGRPTFVHATVLLPRDYDQETERRYPAIFTLGHSVPFDFSTDPRRSNGGAIDPVRGVESGYDFQLAWNSDDFPRVVAISLAQSTPFFADSYSVDSANNGPYGTALVEEIVPALEARFRLWAEPKGRLLEGASTGGWQTLALQLQHPDFFGGAWVLQPDPIDFHRHQLVDVYRDTNAFTQPLGSLTIERPFRRTVEGQVVWTVRQLSLFEEVLGTKGRSGYQLEAWEAVFGPVGEDGYPRPLWNKLTGDIDPAVAESWREHGFDLRDYAERHWPELGPKLAGKLHFFAGDMDDFYLNLAVYRFEEFAKAAKDPPCDATFTYGRPTKGHGWHAWTWAELVREMAAHAGS